MESIYKQQTDKYIDIINNIGTSIDEESLKNVLSLMIAHTSTQMMDIINKKETENKDKIAAARVLGMYYHYIDMGILKRKSLEKDNNTDIIELDEQL